MSDNKKPMLTHYYDLEVEINLDKNYVIVDCANRKYFFAYTNLRDYLMGHVGEKADEIKMPDGKVCDEFIIVERTEYNLYSSTPDKERELKDIKAPIKEVSVSSIPTPMPSSSTLKFLSEVHSHPGMERELGINPTQCIVDIKYAGLFSNMDFMEDGIHIKISREEFQAIKKVVILITRGF